MVVPRYLHVANGTSVTMTLEAAGVPGAMSIWADPLHEGPVPPGVSDDELREVRMQYLGGSEVEHPMNDMRRWRDVIRDHGAYDELVLWFEHDLFDQLNLLQLLTWVHLHVPREKRVTLINVGAFPGYPNFKGLGELRPSDLASLLEMRRPVTAAQYALAEQTWNAFREPTPEPLDDLRRSDTSVMPFLGRALERFLQEYPWTSDGLSRTERQLLHIAEGGPIPMEKVFPRMNDGEDAYYISDMSLMILTDSLIHTSPPLLAFANGTDSAFWGGRASLADAGREVLAGRRDRVACGLDKWLGGVHLQSGSDIWRWDSERESVVRT